MERKVNHVMDRMMGHNMGNTSELARLGGMRKGKTTKTLALKRHISAIEHSAWLMAITAS
jgi:hypothetical protein